LTTAGRTDVRSPAARQAVLVPIVDREAGGWHFKKERAVFNKIIVGVDGREGGRDALALAARLASLFGGELVAVHAYPYDLFTSRGPTPELETIMHGSAQDLLMDELERTHVAAHAAAMPDGSPGRALHLAATRHHGSLIVVGSAHSGTIGRVLAGNVTMGTLHGAECPVIVAPRGLAERGAALQTIGVGFDGSPESRAAAELARDAATAAGARLKVIRVLEPTPPGGPALAYHADWAERAEERRDEAQAQLDAVLAELGEIATGEVVIGDPATELAYAGNELDLLVTGSRGYGPVRRLMLGSTSSRLVREAPCPVLVLTRGAEADAEHPGAGAATARTT
jgi:nucleotide-binding universal stress UspA family protein